MRNHNNNNILIKNFKFVLISYTIYSILIFIYQVPSRRVSAAKKNFKMLSGELQRVLRIAVAAVPAFRDLLHRARQLGRLL